MKSFIYIMFFASVFALFFSSCKEEGYAPGEISNDSGVNVYFSDISDPLISVRPEETEVTFTVERDDAPLVAQDVPVIFGSAHPEAFSVPAYVHFEAMELSAEITVTFTDEMELFKEYPFYMEIDESYTQQYMEQTTYPRIEATIIKEDYETVSEGKYTSWLADQFPPATIDVQYSEIQNMYRIWPWGDAGDVVKFRVLDDGETLELNAQSYSTGKMYKNGDEEEEIVVTVDDGSVYKSNRRTYVFAFSYGISGGTFTTTGAKEDKLLMIK